MRSIRDADEFIELVYDELRQVATRYFNGQPPGFTLRPREIVHEAYIHLARHGPGEWRTIDDFRAIAIRKMWQVVVDHVRQRRTLKRGGLLPGQSGSAMENDTAGPVPAAQPWKRIPLQRAAVEWRDCSVDLLDLADALAELGRANGRLRCVVMLHWFGGMTHAEVAHLLCVSRSTAEKDFRSALAWLNHRLQHDY